MKTTSHWNYRVPYGVCTSIITSHNHRDFATNLYLPNGKYLGPYGMCLYLMENFLSVSQNHPKIGIIRNFEETKKILEILMYWSTVANLKAIGAMVWIWARSAGSVQENFLSVSQNHQKTGINRNFKETKKTPGVINVLKHCSKFEGYRSNGLDMRSIRR